MTAVLDVAAPPATSAAAGSSLDHGSGPTTAPPARRLGRRPALDGLRGVAWMMVFLDHTHLVPWLQFGEVSMYLFFALSGFLITAQLVSEAGRQGHVDIVQWFRRRARRILPALVLMVGVWFVVVALFPHASWAASAQDSGSGGTDLFVAAKGALGALALLTNWLDILQLYGGPFALGHLWFIAVQEQFYLVWVPVFVLLLCRFRRLVVPVALGLAGLSIVEALVLSRGGANWIRVYAGTDTRAAAILLGAALAVWWTEGRLDFLRHRVLGLAVSGGAVIGLIWTLSAFTTAHASTTDSLAWVVATVAAAVVVASIVVREWGALAWVLGRPTLVYLGSRSYALFLWHYVWLSWLAGLGLLGIVASLLASLVCAEISWRLVEERFIGARRQEPIPASA
jgi:peptidoglycan/LPS O-acetylase OafA/YrhL